MTEETQNIYQRAKGFAKKNKLFSTGLALFIPGYLTLLGSLAYKGTVPEMPRDLAKLSAIESKIEDFYKSDVNMRDVFDSSIRDSLENHVANLVSERDSLESLSVVMNSKENYEQILAEHQKKGEKTFWGGIAATFPGLLLAYGGMIGKATKLSRERNKKKD